MGLHMPSDQNNINFVMSHGIDSNAGQTKVTIVNEGHR